MHNPNLLEPSANPNPAGSPRFYDAPVVAIMHKPSREDSGTFRELLARTRGMVDAAVIRNQAPPINRPIVLTSPHEENPAYPPGAQTRYLAYRAAVIAGGHPAGLLLMEDDAHIVDTELFERHLDSIRQRGWQYPVAVFCAVNPKHYAPTMLADWHRDALRGGRRPVLAHFQPMPHFDAPTGARGGFHGTMATWLPARLVRMILEHPEEHVTPGGGAPIPPNSFRIPADQRHNQIVGIDLWIRDNARKVGGIMVAIPNPVDHLGDDPATERWRSPTAGWTWRA